MTDGRERTHAPAHEWGHERRANGAILIAVTHALTPVWFLIASLGIDVSWLAGPLGGVPAAGSVLLLAGFGAGLPQVGRRAEVGSLS